jgi:hypothetical protein
VIFLPAVLFETLGVLGALGGETLKFRVFVISRLMTQK